MINQRRFLLVGKSKFIVFVKRGVLLQLKPYKVYFKMNIVTSLFTDIFILY